MILHLYLIHFNLTLKNIFVNFLNFVNGLVHTFSEGRREGSAVCMTHRPETLSYSREWRKEVMIHQEGLLPRVEREQMVLIWKRSM